MHKITKQYQMLTIIMLSMIIAQILMNGSSALTYQNNVNVDFTLNPTINVTLSSNDLIIDNLAPGSASDSNIITATVSTNAGWGYYLSATANTSTTNTSLTHETSNSNIFTSLNSNKSTLLDFSDNTWGYSYCNSTTSMANCDNSTNWVSGDTGSATTGYNGLPLDNNDSGSTGIKLLNPNSYASSGSIQFKIGAKAGNTQAAGTYTGTINFYAVTNPQALPYMQDMNNTTLNYLMPNIHDIALLVDKRDEQTYRVAKLADGKYWMVENLNLAGESALYSETSDVPDGYDEVPYFVLPESSTSGFSDNSSEAYVYNSGNILCGESSPCYSYYSWLAATAGSGSTISTQGSNAPYSICPSAWKLPTSLQSATGISDFRNLLHSYGMNSNNYYANANTLPTGADIYENIKPGTGPNFVLSGNFRWGKFYSGGSYGGYWSATYYADDSALDFYLMQNMLDTASRNNHGQGLAVRCIFSGQ